MFSTHVQYNSKTYENLPSRPWDYSEQTEWRLPVINFMLYRDKKKQHLKIVKILQISLSSLYLLYFRNQNMQDIHLISLYIAENYFNNKQEN